MLHHETRIYQSSLRLIRGCRTVHAQLPTGYAFLADQLRRASSSISLNFAEGFAKRSPRDRRRYFDSAKGSANEVAAILDVAHAHGVVSDERHAHLRNTANHIAAMLSNFR